MAACDPEAPSIAESRAAFWIAPPVVFAGPGFAGVVSVAVPASVDAEAGKMSVCMVFGLGQ
mgnify:CR=1 FL=1